MEAAEGLQLASAPTAPASAQYMAAMHSSQGGNGGGGVLHWAQSAVALSGASWMAYKLVREWVLPKFFDIADPAQERINLLQTQVRLSTV